MATWALSFSVVVSGRERYRDHAEIGQFASCSSGNRWPPTVPGLASAHVSDGSAAADMIDMIPVTSGPAPKQIVFVHALPSHPEQLIHQRRATWAWTLVFQQRFDLEEPTAKPRPRVAHEVLGGPCLFFIAPQRVVRIWNPLQVHERKPVAVRPNASLVGTEPEQLRKRVAVSSIAQRSFTLAPPSSPERSNVSAQHR